MSLADVRTVHTRSQYLLLIGTVVASLLGLEFLTRFGAMRLSKVERTIDEERVALLGIRSPSASVLIVGNSLLQEGVDIAEVNKHRVGPDTVLRYAIAQTQYVDWAYGLQAFWREGRGPSTVVMMMSPQQFASSAGRGDYAALRLVSASDLVKYGMDLGQHPTELSRTILSHFSAYFGFRNELRKNIIGRVIPGLPEFMNQLAVSGKAPTDTAVLARKLELHFAAIDSIATKYGIKVAVAVPPLLESDAETAQVCKVASSLGIGCLSLSSSQQFGSSMFRDGFHLNESGAKEYSRLLAIQLNNLWANQTTQVRNQ